MRVWVIGRGYPTERNQMLGSFELEQAKMLARGDMEVVYPVIDMRSIRHLRKLGLILKKEDGVIIATLNVPIGRLVNKKIRSLLYIRLMKQLGKKLIKKHRSPDVIHIHYPAIFSYKIVESFQKSGAKVIATEHWTKVLDKTLNEKCLQNLKDFVEKGDAVCCVGQKLKESIVDLTKTDKEIFVIPNVINSVFEHQEIPHDGFRFITSGRLVPVKQFDKVVEAFINVFKGNSNITLTIVGEGEERLKIKKIIIDNKAESQVSMLGEVPREKMANLMNASDALVVFSELETFCVPVIEAWACGKPVTATTSTVFAENPDSRLGIMVDCQDIKSLENAMRYIYKHYSDYNPIWISKYARERFSEEVVLKKLERIYKECLSKYIWE